MSTSKLQKRVSKLLSHYLNEYTIRENIRPPWLQSSNGGRLELDFYIEELNTAIEVQGQQHFSYNPLFHKTYDDFRAQVERDKEKRELCTSAAIKLIEIANESEAIKVIESLSQTKIICKIHPNAIAGTYVCRSSRRNTWDSHVNRWARIIKRAKRKKNVNQQRIQKYEKKIAKKLTERGFPTEQIKIFIERL